MSVLIGGVSGPGAADAQLAAVLDGVRAAGLGHHVGVEAVGSEPDEVAPALSVRAPSAAVLVGVEHRPDGAGPLWRRRLRRPPGPESEPGAVPGFEGTVDALRRRGLLPDRTVAIGMRPGLGDEAVASAVALVVGEARRMPLLALGDETRAYTADDGRLEPTAALDALRALLDELDRVDAEGGWGELFARGADLQRAIAEGHIGEGMGCVDWAMWWGLLEELERLGGVGTGASAAAPGPLRR